MVQYLITGAAGMMGTHLYETLKSRGKDVLATYHQPTIDERDDFMKELERQEKLDLLSFSNVVKVIEIYKHHACEEDKLGDEEDLLSDIYCDFFDAWSCDENLYFAGGHFYWKPFNDEEIVLKEGTY